MEYEQMGLKTEAAEYYYQALVRKRDNIEAKLGLKRTGQIVLDERLNAFNNAYSSGDNTQAVQEYLKAQNYYDALVALGVELNFPSHYKQYYNEAKNVFLEEQYLKAIQLLENKEFSEAEAIFRNILSFGNYRDCNEKLEIAVCEPKYLNIIQLMEIKKFRTAYSKILNLQKISFSYKDIADLKNECLEKGTVTVIFPAITAKSQQKALSESLKLNIINALHRLNNPFLKIVESEKSTGISGQVVLLNCNIQSFEYFVGKLSKTETKGWLRKVTIDDESDETTTTYSKVLYNVYQQNTKLSLDFNYKLSDHRTGQILKSNSKTFVAADNLHYATFDGSHKNLVQGTWKNKILPSKDDRIDDNPASNQHIRSLLNARKTLKSYDDLSEEVIDPAIQLITYDIQKFLSNE